jgi:hypothetical protein
LVHSISRNWMKLVLSKSAPPRGKWMWPLISRGIWPVAVEFPPFSAGLSKNSLGNFWNLAKWSLSIWVYNCWLRNKPQQQKQASFHQKNVN